MSTGLATTRSMARPVTWASSFSQSRTKGSAVAITTLLLSTITGRILWRAA